MTDPRTMKVEDLCSELINLCLIVMAGTIDDEQRRLWSRAIADADTAKASALRAAAATWKDR